MMRIAIAGGGGLGYLLASQLSQATRAYNIMVLSRTARPEYVSLDVEVQVVDYKSIESLRYALQGIDLVLSTVSGPEQLSLINAASRAHVRLFVPAEFEGSLSHRPASALGETQRTLETLRQVSRSTRMRYTVFSCGIFMERFHPNGLTHFNIGYRTAVPGPNEFLVDLAISMVAEYPLKDARGKTIRVCLTSVYDLAKFIVAAIEHGPGNWPREFTLRGDRLSVEDLVKTCSYVANTTLEHRVLGYTEIQPLLDYYRQTQDARRVCVMQQLLDVADGRYDFSTASLNEVIARSRDLEVQPMPFLQWFSSIWQAAAGPQT